MIILVINELTLDQITPFNCCFRIFLERIGMTFKIVSSNLSSEHVLLLVSSLFKYFFLLMLVARKREDRNCYSPSTERRENNRLRNFDTVDF